ncbi:MAG: FtsW/RodA/SpoVE family cell cycle protein, partial [Butyrivibrio sp.]|nr:FtsW/RodA/SpoVE family cell cycle protein [Butyrivibrio sp.]
MEEYIKMLLEQVRFQKAHKAIGDELRSHIEDQIENNISEGMDKETAEKIAVEDMGDPVEAGIALDKVHRPQVAWGV